MNTQAPYGNVLLGFTSGLLLHCTKYFQWPKIANMRAVFGRDSLCRLSDECTFRTAAKYLTVEQIEKVSTFTQYTTNFSQNNYSSVYALHSTPTLVCFKANSLLFLPHILLSMFYKRIPLLCCNINQSL